MRRSISRSPGNGGLLFRRDGIEVGRGDAARCGAQLAGKFFKQARRAFRSLALQGKFKNRLQRLAPFIAIARTGVAGHTGT